MTGYDAVEWPPGTPLVETDLRAFTEGVAGNGVVAAGDLELSESTTDLAVDVAAGDVWYEGTRYNHGSSATVSLDSADASDDRWDTIYFDTTDTTAKVRSGTPFDPATDVGDAPDIQADEVFLGVVYVEAGATDVSDSDIHNWRVHGRNADNTEYNDSTGVYSVDSVAAALDELQEAAQASAYPLALASDTDRDLDGNDLDDAGTTVWDTSAAVVPQGQLGGPASSLTSYPLPIGDLDSPFALPSISDLDLAGNDLVDASTTVWDTSEGYVPRGSQETDVVTASITTDTTSSGEEVFFVDSSGGAVTVTLASADAVDGRRVSVKDSVGSANTNNITIATEGTESIDGGNEEVIAGNYGSRSMVSDGSDWFIVGEYVV